MKKPTGRLSKSYKIISDMERLVHEQAERIKQLEDALEEMTPMLPPVNAPCHIGITTQDKCAHCSRVKNAISLLNKGDNL